MNPDELQTDTLYYLPDLYGVSALRFLRPSHEDDPERWFFWNTGRGQARALTRVELLFLCSSPEGATTKRKTLLEQEAQQLNNQSQ